jgi:hypothetical protein
MKKLFKLIIGLIFILNFHAYSDMDEYSGPPREPDVKGGFKECSVFIYKYANKKKDMNSKKIDRRIKYDNNGKMYEIEEFENIKSEDSSQIYKFDNAGNLIEEIEFKKDGSISRSYSYKYDTKGNMIEKISTFLNGDKYNIHKQICKYDDSGNIVEKYVDISDSIYIYTIFEYFSLNDKQIKKVIHKVGFESSNTYTKMSYKKSDEKGNLIEEGEFNDDESFEPKRIYKYNKKGNVIEKNEYLKNGKLLKKTSTKYNDKDSLIERIIEKYFPENLTLRDIKTIKYNDSGKKIEELDFSSDSLQFCRIKFNYDSSGNLIEIIDYYFLNMQNQTTQSLNVYKVSNKYDEYGNIIEGVQYNMIELASIKDYTSALQLSQIKCNLEFEPDYCWEYIYSK